MKDIGPQITWFEEGDLPLSEQDVRISFRTTKTLYDKHSKYGHIQIFDTPFLGRILVIDGIINIADRTEFIYHEMMVTLPCIRHGNPKNILIIGGGDGGAAKQALKIKTIEDITQVEIDEDVINACKEYLPNIANNALEDDKVELIVDDGMNYLGKSSRKFDIIVLDVSDPVEGGPAENLLSLKFYKEVASHLNSDGIVLTHCGSLIFQAKKAKKIHDVLTSIFSSVTMHIALIPEFELTDFGFFLCTNNNKSPSKKTINHRFTQILTQPSKFLSPEVYFSSKVLSPYIEQLTGVSNN